MALRDRCRQGLRPACRLIDSVVELAAWPPPSGPVVQRTTARCTPADPGACANVVDLATLGLAPLAELDGAAAIACDGGHPSACLVRGQRALVAGGRDPVFFARACSLGSSLGCGLAAAVVQQADPDEVDEERWQRAQALLDDACRLGSAAGCFVAARRLDSQSGHAVRIGHAAVLRTIGCHRIGGASGECQRLPPPTPMAQAYTTAWGGGEAPAFATGRADVATVAACSAGLAVACQLAEHQTLRNTNVQLLFGDDNLVLRKACAAGAPTSCGKLLAGASGNCARLNKKDHPEQAERECNDTALATKSLDDACRRKSKVACQVRRAACRAPACTPEPAPDLVTMTVADLDRRCRAGAVDACAAVAQRADALLSTDAAILSSPAVQHALDQLCSEEYTEMCPVVRRLRSRATPPASGLAFLQRCRTEALDRRRCLEVAAAEEASNDAAALAAVGDFYAFDCRREAGDVGCARYLAFADAHPDIVSLPALIHALVSRAEAVRYRAVVVDQQVCAAEHRACTDLVPRGRVLHYEELRAALTAPVPPLRARAATLHAEATTLLQQACDIGHTPSCLRHADAVDQGLGVSRDEAAAAAERERICSATLLRAFDRERERACGAFAGQLLAGRGVGRDAARAREILNTRCGTQTEPVYEAVCGLWPAILAANGAVSVDVARAERDACEVGDRASCLAFARRALGPTSTDEDRALTQRWSCAAGIGSGCPSDDDGCFGGDTATCDNALARFAAGDASANAVAFYVDACRALHRPSCQRLRALGKADYGTNFVSCLLGDQAACRAENP